MSATPARTERGPLVTARSFHKSLASAPFPLGMRIKSFHPTDALQATARFTRLPLWSGQPDLANPRVSGPGSCISHLL
jgi:hypothetical protein